MFSHETRTDPHLAIAEQATDKPAPTPMRSEAAGDSAPLKHVAAATSGDVPSNSGPVSWQTAMKRAIRRSDELCRYVGIDPAFAAPSAEGFPTFVPLEFADRIKRGDPSDPILRQVLPADDERHEVPGFVADPVGDLRVSQAGGVLHKYDGRALIVTHGACAVHCRYCFRKEFPYSELNAQKSKWKPALDYIRSDPSIEEVLLSGGDPLVLSDQSLRTLVEELESISHVRRLRLHTRLPIVIPQRITDALLDLLAESSLMTWLVIHANHSQEFDPAVVEGLTRMRRRGIALLNQSVLLSQVNDDVESLCDLSKTLINAGVQPYYLHQLDQVRGASHFWVPPEKGLELIDQLRTQLPGYAVPTFVREQSGQPSKTLVV
ncbi:EF-P beta-lysylation protein EpmB [Roseiconus lacunae]|uniref:L-lysine 2,3-aminomutase n=1 Tax=Roseiconus lacunae TaxID=2605694 RepID=A0ABT7PSC4_9BACT|nr:EF-P beta-lysylation protein EpmB [Roseiconus lacunae]MDM4019253.1 EF-P beta-lysylation protein EpmB [Roseiconus lacunae]